MWRVAKMTSGGAYRPPMAKWWHSDSLAHSARGVAGTLGCLGGSDSPRGLRVRRLDCAISIQPFTCPFPCSRQHGGLRNLPGPADGERAQAGVLSLVSCLVPPVHIPRCAKGSRRGCSRYQHLFWGHGQALAASLGRAAVPHPVMQLPTGRLQHVSGCVHTRELRKFDMAARLLLQPTAPGMGRA